MPVAGAKGKAVASAESVQPASLARATSQRGQATVRAAMAVQADRERDRAQEFVLNAGAPWDEAAFSGHYWLRLSSSRP